jgi:hypothetical protein
MATSTQRRITFGKGTDRKPGKTAPTISHDGLTLRAGKPKTSETQRTKDYARGGDDKMFRPQAAGPVKPGQTGKAQNTAPGAQRAAGGTMPRSGGVSKPAPASHTGPPGATASQSTRNYSKGGLARPARPGECGT